MTTVIIPDISEYAAQASISLAFQFGVEQDQVTWHGQLADVPLNVIMCDHADPNAPRTYGVFLLKTWKEVAIDDPFSVGYGDAITVMYLRGQCSECKRVHFGQVKQFIHA